jgi:hypothetical protein
MRETWILFDYAFMKQDMMSLEHMMLAIKRYPPSGHMPPYLNQDPIVNKLILMHHRSSHDQFPCNPPTILLVEEL